MMCWWLRALLGDPYVVNVLEHATCEGPSWLQTTGAFVDSHVDNNYEYGLGGFTTRSEPASDFSIVKSLSHSVFLVGVRSRPRLGIRVGFRLGFRIDLKIPVFAIEALVRQTVVVHQSRFTTRAMASKGFVRPIISAVVLATPLRQGANLEQSIGRCQRQCELKLSGTSHPAIVCSYA